MSPRTLFAPYIRLFAVPGSPAFSFVGWLARLPMPMVGLGAVLLVAGETGSYGLAGAVAGTLALTGSFTSPMWARAMDRRGQGVVLRLAMAGYLLAGTAFAGAVVTGAPRWSWFLLAALTGATGPNIGSLVRARWAHALDVDGRRTAFAFESVVDELVFVVGPPLVVVLATTVNPATGFLTGILIAAGGGLWLSRLRNTEPPAHPAMPGRQVRRWAALTPGVLIVTGVFVGVGVVFGATDVVVVAFAAEEGAPALAGLALAVYASGSLVAGLAYGLLRPRGSLAARFLGCAVLFGIAFQAPLAVGSIAVLLPVAFVTGMAVAPVLVAGTALVEAGVPRSALTEALTWSNTGLTLGVTAGSAFAGAAVDAWGAETAFAVPALGAVAAAVLALAGAPLLRRAPERGAAVAARVEGRVAG